MGLPGAMAAAPAGGGAPLLAPAAAPHAAGAAGGAAADAPPPPPPAPALRARAALLLFSPACDAVLLVSSSSRPGAWVVPGGGVERGEAPRACALRELWEEAGAVPAQPRALLQLQAAPLLGKRSATHAFAGLLGRLEEEYPESSQRQRQWWPLAQALGALEGSAVGAAVWGAAVEALGGSAAALPAPAVILARLSAPAAAAAAAE